MKIYLTILFITISFTLPGQCKLAKNEVDNFSGNQIRQSKELTVYNKFIPATVFKISLLQDGSDYFVIGDLTHPNVSERTVISEDDKLMVKFSSGEVLTLSAVQHFKSGVTKEELELWKSMTSGESEPPIYLRPRYSSSLKDFKKIANNDIETIRMTYNSGDKLDFKLKEKHKSKIKKTANCLIN